MIAGSEMIFSLDFFLHTFIEDKHYFCVLLHRRCPKHAHGLTVEHYCRTAPSPGARSGLAGPIRPRPPSFLNIHPSEMAVCICISQIVIPRITSHINYLHSNPYLRANFWKNPTSYSFSRSRVLGSRSWD